MDHRWRSINYHWHVSTLLLPDFVPIYSEKGEFCKKSHFSTLKLINFKIFELKPGSETFEGWKKPPITLYQDVYLFNWTNPHELKNKSTKPTFTQLGPYRFIEIRDKVNIEFNKETLRYQQYSTYYFDAEGSNGSLSDVCTSVNMVPLGASRKAQFWNFLMQKAVSMALSSYRHDLHVTKTVRELLYEGYDDEMVSMSRFFTDAKFDRVGLLFHKNGTKYMRDNFEVFTGVDDINKFGLISRFNNATEFPFYEGECKKLKGSTNEFFPPTQSLVEPIHIFAPEMCRSVPMDYEGEAEFLGVKGHKFAAGSRATDNGTLFNETKCYMTANVTLASGLLNCSICNDGFPVFISFPHFYSADPSYVSAVQGIQPVKQNHESYIVQEPVSF